MSGLLDSFRRDWWPLEIDKETVKTIQAVEASPEMWEQIRKQMYPKNDSEEFNRINEKHKNIK
jgi:hypothetical protein